MSVFTRPKRVKAGQQKRWHYEFCVRGVRYRGSLPEARTKWQAEQAETQIRQLAYQGKYSIVVNAPRLTDFIDETFLPWSKANKSSWRNDVSRAKVIVDFMGPEAIERNHSRDDRKVQTQPLRLDYLPWQASQQGFCESRD